MNTNCFIAQEEVTDSGSTEGNNLIRRYNFKLYPNVKQLNVINRHAEMIVEVWNAALFQREWQYQQEAQRRGKNVYKYSKIEESKPERIGEEDIKLRKKTIVKWENPINPITLYKQSAEIKEIRREFPEFKSLSFACLQECLDRLELAYQRFYKISAKRKVLKKESTTNNDDPDGKRKKRRNRPEGFPKYKSTKRDATIIGYKKHGSGWSLEKRGKNWKLYMKGVPGFVTMRGIMPRDFKEIRTMNLFKRADGWYASIVFFMNPVRLRGSKKKIVKFDLVDCFCSVETENEYNANLISIEKFDLFDGVLSKIHNEGSKEIDLSDLIEKTPSNHSLEIDKFQSERDIKRQKFSYRWKQEGKLIALSKLKQARRRQCNLHVFTSKIIDDCLELTIIAPNPKENTKSARGNEKEHGAEVKNVAMVNRNTLDQAPAMAIEMLRFKAEEAGIPVREICATETKLDIRRDAQALVKKQRRTRRIIRKHKNELQNKESTA